MTIFVNNIEVYWVAQLTNLQWFFFPTSSFTRCYVKIIALSELGFADFTVKGSHDGTELGDFLA